MKNIVTVQFGSHLYGTSTPQSDFDFKSVHLPTATEILLQRVPESVSNRRVKAEGEKNNPGDVDNESFSLQRFFKLLTEGQTTALDMLFAPNESILETSDLWEHIRANKDKFLTKKSAAFVGYCRTQANKYGIKGSRVSAARIAMEEFRSAFQCLGATAKVGDVERDLERICAENPEHMDIVLELPKQHGRGVESFFECCNRKVPYTASVKLAAEIYTRIWQNYGDRARQAEANEGIDWKALSHAVRVGEEALELLNHHTITFPLGNAEHIKNIKLGKVPYEEVANQIEHLLAKVEFAATTSSLPDDVDQTFIDRLIADEYANVVIYEEGYQEAL